MHTFFFSKIVATPKFEGVITMAKAHVGDIIEFKDGLTGIVEKLNENSVYSRLKLIWKILKI